MLGGVGHITVYLQGTKTVCPLFPLLYASFLFIARFNVFGWVGGCWIMWFFMG